MKKIVLRLIIGVIIGIISWGVVSLILSEGLGESFSSITEIENVKVLMEIDRDGLLMVTETIDYRFKKPYRGIYRELPADRAGSLYGEIEVTATGKEIKYIERMGGASSRSIRLWFVPYNSSSVEPSGGQDRVTVTYRYTVRRAVEIGTNVAQIFRKVWGEDTASWVKNVNATITFPEGMQITNFYTHPAVVVTRSGNVYELEMKDVPPKSYVEFRAVVPLQATSTMKQVNLATGGVFDSKFLESAERKDSLLRIVSQWVVPIAVVLFTPFVLLVAFRKYGREHEVGYFGDYERELPTDDAADVVNAAVKNMAGVVDNDGIGSVMMELYRKNYIDFERGKGDKVDGILIKNRDSSDLRPTEAAFLKFLDKYDENDLFDFSDVKKKATKSQSKARTFTSDLSVYKDKVNNTVKSKKLLDTRGNSMAKGYSTLMLLLSILMLMVHSNPAISHLRLFSLVFYGALWTTSFVVFMMPRDVFGRWTPEGRVFYLKWMGLKRYLEDYSLLNEKPPESIILWEEYLVYATALGIADTVRKNLNRIVPEDIWREQSRHPFIYYPVTAYAINSFNTLTTSVRAASSSGSGGGGFGGGGSGGGGGGGGTGGF